MDSPQTTSPNVLLIDFADNPKLREIFSHKEVGDECKLTVEIEVTEKRVDGVVCAIEKVIADPSDYYDNEATPKPDEPIMMKVMSGKMRKEHGKASRGSGGMGPHNRPPQPAENMQEPWMNAYT